MSEREILYLLGEDGAVLWSDAGTPSALPDSRARWEAIWAARDRLAAVAHSHPGGPLGFSGTDRGTMAALDAALGRSLTYLVVAPDGVIGRRGGEEALVEPEPAWAAPMRTESGMEERRKT
jgi:hypothetical protein